MYKNKTMVYWARKSASSEAQSLSEEAPHTVTQVEESPRTEKWGQQWPILGSPAAKFYEKIKKFNLDIRFWLYSLKNKQT